MDNDSIGALHRERVRLPACMRTPEAARYVGLSVSSLMKMRMTDAGPPFLRVGTKAVAYRQADLDAWLETRVRRPRSGNLMTA